MINEQTLRQWWQIFKNGKDLVEVRILGKFTYSGYYKNIDKLIADIRPYEEMSDEQIYFTLNDIDEGCYGRQQCEQLVKNPKSTTTDNNITRRRWVMIDFDPVRVVGVNSTDEEFELARLKAQEVYNYLLSIGFSQPVICRSGNGWHILFKCDLPNDDETKEILEQFLQSLAFMFTDSKIDIDEKVFNAARICKLYGTTAKKGANLPERPWRESSIAYVPDEIKETDISLFKYVASLLPKEEPRQTLPYNSRPGEQFDLRQFLDTHGVQYKVETCSKWTKYILDHCFFNPEHKHKDAAIIQMANGAIKYCCLHNTCSHHTWQEVRLMLDPHAYDPKTQYQQQYPQRVFQQPVQPQAAQQEIKPESIEIGKKWFSLSDIQKVDLNEIEHFKTGFKELDRAIKGMFVGELTIVSGSNSSGKSSWLNSVILNIIQQGWKVALWSGELRADVLKTWIQMVAAGKSHMRCATKGNYWFVPNEIGQKVDKWLDGKFFLYNNEYGSKWEQIFADMKTLLSLGVRVFVLDNLMSIDIDIFGGSDNNKQQKELIKQIVDFNKQNKTHVILVAHPRKVTTLIRKNDISGTGDISNAADNIFLMHRCNRDFKNAGTEFFGKKFKGFFLKDKDGNDIASAEYENMVEIAKNRMMGAQDEFCGMFYEIESRRFKNTPDEVREYGWNIDGVQMDMFADEDSTPTEKATPTVQELMNGNKPNGDSQPFNSNVNDLPF